MKHVTAAPFGSGEAARKINASLWLAVRGGRTTLAAQHAPYPFHLTRVFYLDPQRPDLATLYLQSASGGVYRGDRLALDVHVASGAAAHLTTQSSAVVHDTRGCGAAQTTRITVEPCGFVAVTPDPLVLFPGSAIAITTEVVLGADACAILTDGFGSHDPQGEGRTFERYAVSTTLRDQHGDVLIAERGSVRGGALAGNAGPLGPYQAAGTLMVLGRQSDRLDMVALEGSLDALGCLAGFGALPNGAGLGGRILAPEGGALRLALDVAFRHAFEALLGSVPARRRK